MSFGAPATLVLLDVGYRVSDLSTELRVCRTGL